ncbi:sensor histidine kinase [Marinitenerispora sediminis]|uniref:Histidine kinase n=1 Tax=Marinitenerispora sediminis TaxID=1931232 RepID=A0A368T1G7_9ACTN|nr:GAF domain-containing protein [Marinitenerispora sediminis]RCV48747.1 histidine kinase [Marinitenerispora sediminis]RCV48758.1 histidine kinase [Marinitenerispora sediminis]RCV54193.1 histidine kinase [Marinitenerispora sediminis]
MADETPGTERGRELLPNTRLDDLLSELQSRVTAALLTRDRVHALLNAVVLIGTGLDLETLLRRIVEAATKLVDARYGALGVISSDGRLLQFLPVGLGREEISRIEHWPEGEGILGLLIKEPQSLRLDEISGHPESRGFPHGHPPMHSFLGVPIRVRDEVFGNLYLTEKAGGAAFDEDDEAIVTALATAAGVAIENARLYDATRCREQWLDASGEITTRLLSGAASGEVLHMIAARARLMAEADLVAIALAEDGADGLTVRVAEGAEAERVTGRTIGTDGTLPGRVLRGGEPAVGDVGEPGADEAALAATGIGPVLLVPLGGGHSTQGVLLLGRQAGRPAFTPSAARTLHAFAGHAAVALELAESRRATERLTVLEDRDRIARELHDIIIQRLFAVAMSLMSSVKRIDAEEPARRVRHAVEDLDDTIRQIRSTIFALQSAGDGERQWLRNQILELVESAKDSLDCTPGLRLDGPIDSAVPDEVADHLLAVLQEALSNVARHAHAHRVDVRVRVDTDLLLEVEDDGSGIPERGRRSGLRNLAERARLLGGRFEAVRRPAGGTRLTWRVPLPDEE